MARADAHPTTNLSTLIRDPFVRAAFEAAQRDGLAPLAVLIDTPPSLNGGHADVVDRGNKPASPPPQPPGARRLRVPRRLGLAIPFPAKPKQVTSYVPT